MLTPTLLLSPTNLFLLLRSLIACVEVFPLMICPAVAIMTIPMYLIRILIPLMMDLSIILIILQDMSCLINFPSLRLAESEPFCYPLPHITFQLFFRFGKIDEITR